jgi:hypothetical protein
MPTLGDQVGSFSSSAFSDNDMVWGGSLWAFQQLGFAAPTLRDKQAWGNDENPSAI